MKIKSSSFLLALSITPTLTFAALGPIIITPSAYHQPKEGSSTPITVITQETIKNSGATSVAELLRGQAGLQVRDIFGDGSQVTVDLRGFGSTAATNTLILIDGRRLNNSSDSGAPDLSTINIENIKQIEILQGSAGVLYGNQAIGGVINIIRKKFIEDSAQISTTLGSNHYLSTAMTLNHLVGKTKLSLYAKSLSSDNYRDNNDADKNHFSIRAERPHNTFTSYIEIERTDDHLLAPGALLQSEIDVDRAQSLSFYDGNYFDTLTNVFRAGIDINIDQDSSLNVDFSQRTNDREFNLASRPYASSFSTQDRKTKNLSSKYIVNLNNALFTPTVVIGLNLESTDYELDALYLDTVKQDINALYISTDFHIDSQSQFNIGLRTSHQNADITTSNSFSFGSLPSGGIKTITDNQTVFSASYTHKINNIKLHLRADQNFKFPSVEEHTNVASGNDIGLDTQTGTSIELGSEIKHNTDSYRITYYQLNLENELGYDESFGTGFNLNLDDTSRTGIILEAHNTLSDKFSSSLSFTHLNAKLTAGAFKGNTLPLVPKETLRLSGAYQLNKQILMNIEMIHVDEQVFGGDFSNLLGTLNSYKVLNTHLNYSQKQLNVSFRINNLLNEKYSESGNQFTDYSNFPAVSNLKSFFTAPERNYWLTVQYTF